MENKQGFFDFAAVWSCRHVPCFEQNAIPLFQKSSLQEVRKRSASRWHRTREPWRVFRLRTIRW